MVGHADWLGREKAFLCAQLSAGEDRPDPPPGIDWAAFAGTVRHHRLALALGRLLPGMKGLPENARQSLMDMSRLATMRALGRMAETVRLTSALENQGVPALVLKGCATSVQFHGQPAARISADIDLMVMPRDGKRAAKILAGLGYAPRSDWRTWEESFAETALFNAERRQAVDLHVRLAQDDRLFPMALVRPFETAACLELGQGRIRTLPVEAALVHAAMHGCKHLWRRLGWLYDIAHASRNGLLPWKNALGLAAELGAERQLVLTALLAGEVFAVPLPRELADHEALPMARLAIESLKPILAGANHDEDIEAVRAMGRLRYLVWENRLHHGWRRRLSALLVHARPSPTDVALIRLPAPLRPLYLPVRALRVLWSSLRP